MSFAKSIDQTIDKLFGKNNQPLTRNESLQYIGTSLDNLILAYRQDHPDKQMRQVLCTGTMAADEIRQIVSQLASLLDQPDQPERFALVAGADLMTSASSMAALEQSDSVVLFEKENQSRYDQVEEIMHILKTMHKDVLGMVVVA